MTDQCIRILIVDDHAVVRKGLAMVLRLEADFDVVGEAGDGEEGVALAGRLKPDLVLLDLVMPRLDGAAAARAMRQALPDMHILLLTGAETDPRLAIALANGADGYVLKDIEPEDLKQAIRRVANGEAALSPSVARSVLGQLSSERREAFHPPLTRREQEILQWMATPATYAEIAGKLVVSEETVRSHAKSVLRKMGQPNRIQAVLAAVRAGSITLPDA